MAILNYAGFSALASTTWNLDTGEYYTETVTPQISEQLAFGTETLYVGYKEIEVVMTLGTNILNGVLYVADLGGGSLEVKFKVGDAERILGDFDLSVGLLIIYTTDSNILMKYVP